jgi:hypothetical protein
MIKVFVYVPWIVPEMSGTGGIAWEATMAVARAGGAMEAAVVDRVRDSSSSIWKRLLIGFM